MFDKIGRSWEFAKISYGLLWDFKQLIIFPLLSTIAVTSAADVIFKPCCSTTRRIGRFRKVLILPASPAPSGRETDPAVAAPCCAYLTGPRPEVP